MEVDFTIAGGHLHVEVVEVSLTTDDIEVAAETGSTIVAAVAGGTVDRDQENENVQVKSKVSCLVNVYFCCFKMDLAIGFSTCYRQREKDNLVLWDRLDRNKVGWVKNGRLLSKS